MTREEFSYISTWRELQDAMRSVDYYDELDGDLYEYESDVVDAFEWAVRNECRCIADIQRMDIGDFDDCAGAWCVFSDFSYVKNYYSEEFDEIRADFYEWLVDNEMFDEDEDPEESESKDVESEGEIFDGNLELVLFGV